MIVLNLVAPQAAAKLEIAVQRTGLKLGLDLWTRPGANPLSKG
jgi:hypothetical protein